MMNKPHENMEQMGQTYTHEQILENIKLKC